MTLQLFMQAIFPQTSVLIFRKTDKEFKSADKGKFYRSAFYQ